MKAKHTLSNGTFSFSLVIDMFLRIFSFISQEFYIKGEPDISGSWIGYMASSHALNAAGAHVNAQCRGASATYVMHRALSKTNNAGLGR